MRNYELVYIVSPDVEEENLEAVTDRIGRLIANSGGQVLRLDSWGRRRMAYPIRKFRHGHYIFAQIQLEPGAITELRRGLALTEEVIRYLLVTAEEKKLEPAKVPERPPAEPTVPEEEEELELEEEVEEPELEEEVEEQEAEDVEEEEEQGG